MLPPDLLEIIEVWQTNRAAVYGKIPDQLRTFQFTFVQDHWVAVAMSKEGIAIVLKLVDDGVNCERSINTTAKWAVKLASFNICEAVGALYHATESKRHVSPRLTTVKNYESMAGDVLAQIKAFISKSSAVSCKTIDSFCSLHGHTFQFVLDGNALRNFATSLLQSQKAATRYKHLVRKVGTAINDIKVILDRCARNELTPPLRSPKVVYGGRLGLAANACAFVNYA